MGFYFDGSGQRTHRPRSDDLERDDVEQLRPSPGKSSRTHGGGTVRGIPGKVSLAMRLAQRIARTHDGPESSRDVAHALVQRSLARVDVDRAAMDRPEQPDERYTDEFAGLFERSEHARPGSTGEAGARDDARAAHTRDLDEAKRALGLAGETLDVRIDEKSRRRNEAQQSSGLVVDGAVHLHPERYEPGTRRGRYLLAHELAHIGQHRLGKAHGARVHPSMAEREAHALASAFAQGRPLHAPAVALGPHVAAADTGSQSGDEAGSAVGSYARVVDVSPYLILRRQRDPRPLSHDAETARRDPLVVELLRFNDRVMVLAAFAGNWVEVVTDDGKRGYIDRNYIIANPPEPTARLYRTRGGDTALGIAMAHYDGVEWGKDSRFYVNVLVHTNQGRGDVGLYTRDGSTDWEDAEVKENYWIWIPGQAFADSLHGVLSSGSISYEAVQGGKAILAFTLGYHAGMFDGVKDALTDVVELISAVWEAIASLGGSILDSITELWDAITNLDAEALLETFLDRWNAPDPWEKWNFRGWLVGFAIMLIAIEVLLAIVTGGVGNAARWSAKAAKLGKLMDFLKGLGVVKKVQAKVRAAGEKIPGLDKLARIGDEGTDAADKGTDAADKGTDAAKVGQLAPKSWAKFNPEHHAEFKERLQAFRGNGDVSPTPGLRGGEGQLFLSQKNEFRALKRWFQSRQADMNESIRLLEDAGAGIASNPKLKADIDVVKIHQKGSDWVLRDFDPDSAPLREALDDADVSAAHARAIAELRSMEDKGALPEALKNVLKKLEREPPSLNLHWSADRGKIWIIDLQ